MNSTIVRSQLRNNGDIRIIQIANTVYSTVIAIGAGKITTAHVVWAINSQVTKDYEKVTAEQVERVLYNVSQKCQSWTRSGKGNYRWDGTRFLK